MLLAAFAVTWTACSDGSREPAFCGDYSFAEVFTAACVHRIDFVVTPQAWDALNLVDRPEVHARMTFDGLPFSDVGLRLKGAGSYDTMDGKPAFNVDLNQWIPGTKLQGLKAFRLHNGKAWDPTFMHEWLSYELARDAGLLAPRVGWAVVSVNNQPFGLYVLVEKHDDVLIGNRDPAQKALGVILEPTGTFVDLGVGDLAAEGEDLLLACYDEGPRPPDTGVIAAILAIDAVMAGEPTEAAVEALFKHVVRATFLDYLGWEAVVEHQDGYRTGANWRLFVDGTTYQIEWVATGADSTWANGLGSGDVFLTFRSLEAARRAFRFCMEVPSCRRGYAESILSIADRVESLDLARRFDEISEMLDPCLAADPRSHFDHEQRAEARKNTMAALKDQVSAIRDVVYMEYPDLAP